MWYEAFVISSSTAGVLAFLIYVLAHQIARRIPTAEQLIDEADKRWDIGSFFGSSSSPSGGGRKAEGWAGMIERFIATPVGQDIAKKVLGGIGGAQGGMTNYGP